MTFLGDHRGLYDPELLMKDMRGEIARAISQAEREAEWATLNAALDSIPDLRERIEAAKREARERIMETVRENVARFDERVEA